MHSGGRAILDPLVWRGVCAVAALLGLLLASGCGEGEGSNRGPGGVWPDEVPVDDAMKRQLEQGGSAQLVLSFVEDGTLDFVEYEQLVLEHVQCTAVYGLEPADGYPRLTPWGAYQMKSKGLAHARAESLGYTPEEARAGIEQCEILYGRAAGLLWLEGHSPSEAELQGARSAIASCLSGHGIELAEAPSAQELLSEFESAQNQLVWRDCILAVEQTHYISGFGVTIVN